MKLVDSLRASLELLRKQPKIFLPNICVSILYGIYELVLIKLGLDVLASSQEQAGAYLSANTPLLLAAIFIYPFIGTLDLITYSMYPSIVSDYRAGKSISLRRALRCALSAWRIWVSLGLVIIGFIMMMTPLVSLFLGLSYATQNKAFLLIGILLMLFATAFLAVSVFFVIPVGVIDREKTFSCYKKSFLLSIRHRGEVIPLMVLSIALAAFAAIMVSMLSSGAGQAAYAGLLLFLSAKVLQSAVYTYISVVNPYLYIELR